MSITTKQKHDLKKFIAELSGLKARHTELISVYIPQGYDLNKIINHLQQEQGTATNIKSAGTRKNVIDALERMVQHLKLFARTPENGMAVFSGNVAEREGQQNFKVWSIEPPVPLKTRIYRCDKSFVIDLLEEMTETKEVYGLIVMDKREGDLAILKGKAIIPISKHTSNVPGKTRAGGQSSQRFARIREGAAKEFFTRLGESVKDELAKDRELKGIIIGGPGMTKNEFAEGNYMNNEIKKKIIAIKDVTYTGEFGLQELVDRSQDVLAEEEIATEKKIVNKFLELLSTKPGMVNYGENEVMESLKMGMVDTMLISEALEEEKIEKFEKEAKNFGTNVEIISTETREGAQLVNLGKIAAILRYDMG